MADGAQNPGELKIVEDARKAMGLSRADSDTARDKVVAKAADSEED